MTKALLTAALLAALFVPGVARAQDEFALERFQPAPAGDRFLGVPSPYVAGDLDLHFALLADYAFRPLVLDAPPALSKALVSHQAILHADLTLALGRRLLFNLDVPGLSLQAGETTPALHTVDFGDVRLGGRARLFGENGAPFQLGLGGYFWLPSATGATSGDGRVRGMPYVSLGGLAGALLWTGMFGAEFRRSQLYQGAVREGVSLDLAGGVAYLFGEQRRVQLGLETALSFVAAKPSSRNFNAELLLHGRYRFWDHFEIGAGVGPGLSKGVGTATLRGLLFFAYVPVADLTAPRPATSSAEDSIVSGEGLLYRSQRLSRLQSVEQDPRCCAPVSSVKTSSATRRTPTREAPPPYEGILFATSSAEIDARAERSIHAIADYLIQHPEVRRVELCGYADIHGTVESNERLGERRAQAVKQALMRHSVEPERLIIKSYGASDPTAPSTTSDGMRQNRRVVVRVIAATDGASAPVEAP